MLRAHSVPGNSSPAESIPRLASHPHCRCRCCLSSSKFSHSFGEVSRLWGQTVSWLVPVCPVKASGWAGKVTATFPCSGFTTTSQAKGTGKAQLSLLTSWVSLTLSPEQKSCVLKVGKYFFLPYRAQALSGICPSLIPGGSMGQQ